MIIILDLDDTLYQRKHFVENGLLNVVNLIFSKNKNLDKKKIFKSLKKIYYNPRIVNSFNYFIKKKI